MKLLTGAMTIIFFSSIVFASPAGNSPTGSNAQTDQALKIYSTALDALEKSEFRSMTTKDLVYESIHGMFRTLDPYTHFLDENAYDYMRAQQEGSFYGIGISFDIRDGELLVISPIEDSPAWNLGIRAGDRIVEIEGESTAGITSADVLNKLRGKKGAKVHITIMHPGSPGTHVVEITRDKITLDSIRGGFLLDNAIGYIRITEFSSTTAKDLETVLGELKDQGMEKLLLDLQFNGGGLLSAAEDVSSLFLDKDQAIVSTRGRDPENHMELTCKKRGPYFDLPLIILVNESSASASEIVAGAIQDHDRGLIVGKTTHGKGLVGSQFPNKLGSAIQIITAQYFTPSGRYIQKPYSIPHRHAGHKKDTDSDPGKDIHYTDKERPVYGGGGITPDVVLDENLLSDAMLALEAPRVFFDFAVDHGSDYAPIDSDIEISDAMYARFLDYCKEEEIVIDYDNLDAEKQTIKNSIKRELLSVHVSAAAGEKQRVKNLLSVQEAEKLFTDLEKHLS